MSAEREEAKAWREIAATIAGSAGSCFLCIEARRYGPLGETMIRRVKRHMRVARMTEFAAWAGEPYKDDNPIRILAALFLALECESESRSVAGDPR